MCFDRDARPPQLPADRVLVPFAGGAAAEQLTLEGSDGNRFAAALAEAPESAGPAVIVIPDVRGLYRFYIELAERFAEAGHHALAIDPFGRTAGVREREGSFDFMAHVLETRPELVRTDLATARAELVERCGAEAVAVVGFCFGGAQAFVAAAHPELELSAVVGFYGILDPSRTGVDSLAAPLASAARSRVPVLGLFGGADPNIPPEDVADFDSRLDEAGIEHELVTYPGAPHSFFDRSAAEYAEDSADAWRRLLDFLGS